MSGNASYRLDNTAVLSVESVEAPEVITSDAIDDRLVDTYARLGMTRGMLASLAGVQSRRWWPADQGYVQGAVAAGRQALEAAQVEPDQIGLLINASVTRPHLEPAVATQVHHELGLPTGCMNFDVTNACLGFVNAMHLAGTLIDSGQIEHALVVTSEGTREPQERTIARLERGETTKVEIKEAFATLTVGSGAAAMVLARKDANPDGHTLVGGVSRAGTAHHNLCIGSMEEMKTDSTALYTEGLALAVDTWKDAKGEFDWEEMDSYVAHQTSIVHIRGLCDSLGLDMGKFPLTLIEHGNTASASVPFTLAQHSPNLSTGDRVLLMGIGSGLNTSFAELAW